MMFEYRECQRSRRLQWRSTAALSPAFNADGPRAALRPPLAGRRLTDTSSGFRFVLVVSDAAR
jgi:hypothetical protein